MTDQSDDAAPETEEEPTPPPPKARKVGLLAAIALSVVVLDVISKVVVVATVQPNEPVRLLGGLVYLSLIRNPGAAFSMATGMTWLLALIAIGVVVFIVRMAPRLRSTPWAVSAITIGGISLVITALLGIDFDGTRTKSRKAESA